MSRIRVLIADDHAIFREGLAMLLAQQRDIEIIGQAKDGVGAIEMAQELQPDVLLLDIRMPTLDGLAALPEIRAKSPDTKVMILSGYLEEEFIVKALQSGARGYLLKTLTHKELTKAIRALHAGELWAERRVLSLVVEALRQRLQETNHPFAEKVETLTKREREIIKWVMHGKTNKEIAAELTISEKTVKSHVHSIFSKLGVSRRLELLLNRIVEHNEDTP